jgi:hypothetical protein
LGVIAYGQCLDFVVKENTIAGDCDKTMELVVSMRCHREEHGLMDLARQGKVTLINKGDHVYVMDEESWYTNFLKWLGLHKYSYVRKPNESKIWLINPGIIEPFSGSVKTGDSTTPFSQKDNQSPWMKAVASGDLPEIMSLIAKNTDVDHKNAQGITALILAAEAKNSNSFLGGFWGFNLKRPFCNGSAGGGH